MTCSLSFPTAASRALSSGQFFSPPFSLLTPGPQLASNPPGPPVPALTAARSWWVIKRGLQGGSPIPGSSPGDGVSPEQKWGVRCVSPQVQI